MNKSRRNFDLPAQHINETDGSSYIPPRARDDDEIARRRQLRPGSLIREFQASGAKVAQAIYDSPVAEPEDILYIRRRLAVPLFNSAWYTFADNGKTPDFFMRRVLKLPVLASDETDIENSWRASKEFLQGKVRDGLVHSATLASRLSIQYERGLEKSRQKTETGLGRSMGNTALLLINLQNANSPLGMSEGEIQDLVMSYASDLLADARASHENTGYHASIAQLADPESPLSRDWRDNAPRSGGALHALEQAQRDFGMLTQSR